MKYGENIHGVDKVPVGTVSPRYKNKAFIHCLLSSIWGRHKSTHTSNLLCNYF